MAISLAMVMGFVGMAIDVGFLEYQQQSQQAATDAAAMGGAERAADDSCNNTADAKSAAVTDAGYNGYASSYVTVNSPPSSGPYAGNACAVAVTISKQKPTFFSQVLTSNVNGMKVSTQAVGLATQGTGGPGCIWLLSTTAGQSNFSNSNIQVPHCAIYINEFANFSNGTINAQYIGYASGTNDISGAHFTNATPQPMSVVSDPCSTFTGCSWLASNGPTPNETGCSTSWNSNNNGQSVGSLTGGTTCYSNFTMGGSGDTVCGLIEVTGSQFHLNNATITSCASGVTFALASSVQDINFSSAHLTLSAPTSGNTKEVLFWRNSAQSSAVDYSTCTCALTGMLYYPTAQVDYSSNSGDYTVLVFGQGNFSTSTGLDIGTPAPGYTTTSKVSLGE